MIITRTPLRVSFLGGGSDYPAFFTKEPGAVFGCAINLFVFVAVIRQTALVDKRFKLTYRVSEAVDSPSELRHPVVRAVLQELKWEDPGLHIATLADVPANTGLGSSSSFTVSLLHALDLFRGGSIGPEALAAEAVRVERDVLGESGGWQDQYHAAYGGLALYEFGAGGVTREGIGQGALIDGLNESMVLVPVGGKRLSNGFAQVTHERVAAEDGFLMARRMATLARESYRTLSECDEADKALEVLAEAMREAWALKCSLLGASNESASNDVIRHGIQHGALAGKLCGAGGSGFVLFLLPPGDRDRFLVQSGFTNGEIIEVASGGSSRGPIDWI